MKHIKAIIIILITLLAIILIVENLEELSKPLTLRIDFLFWSHKTPPMAFYLVMIIVFLLGVFITGFFGIFERFRLKKEIRALSRENIAKDREMASLRDVPVYQGTREDSEPEQENDV